MADQPEPPSGASAAIVAEADARATLRRHKRAASVLLLFMGLVAAGAAEWQRVRPGAFWPGLVAAAGRAGLVGGLADWFAVTALFRRPLGLPIPHTAILPAQKDRLGRSLGSFVANHVFTDADIERALRTVDLPGLLAKGLRDERAAAAVRGALARAVPSVLAALSDGRAGSLGAALLPAILHERQVAPLVARALRVLVDGDRHQDVLSFLLGEIRALLRSREAHLRALIEERVREQGGRLLGWAIGGSIATRVLGAINAELARTDPRDSELRDAVTTWMRREIDLIEEDPARARELADTLRGLVTHRSLRSWGGDVWRRVRDAVDADLVDPDGAAGRAIDDLLARGIAALEGDAATREIVDRQAGALIRRALPGTRTRLSGFIGGVVANWDPAGLVSRVELRVGRDLQFVRMNGTVVGALVGAVLFGVLRAVFGAGAG